VRLVDWISLLATFFPRSAVRKAAALVLTAFEAAALVAPTKVTEALRRTVSGVTFTVPVPCTLTPKVAALALVAPIPADSRVRQRARAVVIMVRVRFMSLSSRTFLKVSS